MAFGRRPRWRLGARDGRHRLDPIDVLLERSILAPQVDGEQRRDDQARQHDGRPKRDRARRDGSRQGSGGSWTLSSIACCGPYSVEHRLRIQPEVLAVGPDEAARVDGRRHRRVVLGFERFEIASVDPRLALGLGERDAEIFPCVAQRLPEGPQSRSESSAAGAIQRIARRARCRASAGGRAPRVIGTAFGVSTVAVPGCAPAISGPVPYAHGTRHRSRVAPACRHIHVIGGHHVGVASATAPLAGKVAWVTGSSRGLGRVIATHLGHARRVARRARQLANVDAGVRRGRLAGERGGSDRRGQRRRRSRWSTAT